MAFGHFIDPNTGSYTDDHLIGKAMEALRVRFGPALPMSFYGEQWERARLIMKIEGRCSDTIVRSLLPFAEAQASCRGQRDQRAIELKRRCS